MKPFVPRILPFTTAVSFFLLVLAGTLWIRPSAAERIRLSEVSHIHGIAVDPSDPSRLYLATHHGLFLTSPDGTASRVSDNANDYMGFTPHPTDSSLLYASGHPVGGGNMGVILSEDGGKTWQQLSAGAQGPVDFHAMTISRADPNVIYGFYVHGGGIQVSRDSGKTWTVTGSAPVETIDLAASAVDADLIFAATLKGLMLSRDGGKTWEPTGEQGRPVSMIETAPDGTVYALIVGLGLVSTPGSVINWSLLSSDVAQKVILHFAVDPTNPDRVFAVTQESEILASTDGGRSWTPLS
jgi:photosystem II stability/assembly factor-like uncharacterized protein